MRSVLAVLVAALLLPSPALAAYMSADTRIGQDDTVSSALSITLSAQESGSTLKVPIFGDVTNLRYDSNFDGFSCRFEKADYGYDAFCDVSNLKRSGTFKIEFGSSSLVEKKGSRYILVQKIAAPLGFNRLDFKVTLPSGTVLAEDTAYLPFDGSNSTDGRSIFVSWSRENVVAGEVFTAQVEYEKFFGDQNLLIAMVFAAVAIVAIFAIVYRRRLSMKAFLPVLRPDEKKIMEKIIEHKSGVNQKVVVQESGYSKAKVSKVLKSLEERGVLKLERLGRSNRIFLGSKIENKEKKHPKNS